MNYILATGSSVIEYPYSIEKLRSDNPETSFPVVMNDSELCEWGVYPVTEEAAPTVNEATEQAEQAAPALIHDSWMVKWVISEASAEQKVIRTERQALEVRRIRNIKLMNTDYTQLSDFLGSEIKRLEWAEYRQNLRDIPQQDGFPWSVNYPIFPLILI